MSGRASTPFGLFKVNETGLWLRDNSIANVSAARHGLTPKLPNDNTKFFDGTGGWTTPTGTGGTVPDWVRYNQRTPPGSPDVADDEFGGAAYPSETALDTGGTRFTSATAWQWRNQGSSTATIVSGNDGGLLLTPQSGSVFRGVEQAVPVGNWRIRSRITPVYNSGSVTTFEWMMYVANNSNGKAVVGGLAVISAIMGTAASRWTTFSSFSADLKVTSHWDFVRGGAAWIEVEYDGTNVIFRSSPTGEDSSFSLIASDPTASFLGTPSHVGLAAYGAGSSNAMFVKPWRRVA